MAACCQAGRCADALPEVFDNDDEGYVVVLQQRVGTDLLEQVEECVDLCPSRCPRRRARRGRAGMTLLDCAERLGVVAEGPVCEGHGPASAAVALAQDASLAGPAVRRVVALLTRGGPVPEEACSWFVAACRARVGGDVRALLGGWRDDGPWHVESHESVAHRAAVELVGSRGARRTLTVVVDTTGLIRRLDLLPSAPAPRVEDWADVDAVLTAAGADASALVVTRRDAAHAWTVLHERRGPRRPAGWLDVQALAAGRCPRGPRRRAPLPRGRPGARPHHPQPAHR